MLQTGSQYLYLHNSNMNCEISRRVVFVNLFNYSWKYFEIRVPNPNLQISFIKTVILKSNYYYLLYVTI